MFNDWFGNTLTTTPYAWKLEEHAAYSDSSFTRKLDSSDVAPGNNIYIRLKARNMGNKTWDKSFLRLGTYRPTDRKSSFKDTSWLSEVRLASVQEDTVTPGGTGTFDFVLKTPTNPGTHKEHFNLVAESIAWLNDIRLFYQINSVEPATPKNTNNTLPTGSTIRKNEYILSSDLQSTLNLQTDGNLVLYRNFKPVWQSGTNGSKANRLTMQGDGNLVLYDEDNTPLWHTGTYSQPNSRLSLQTDGNLVLYNSSNTPTWHIGNTHNPHLLSVVNILLPKGKKLYPGQQLETADRKFRLTLQQDGNLVLYSTKRATWASVTAGKNVTHLSMQGDGNLVLYANKKAIWHTRTDRKGSSQLKVQQDGNLVIYNKHGQPTWHTKTHGVE